MNLKFAFRTLVRSPYVTVVGVVCLAFGIGGTTSIFSIYHQLLLQSLPVERSGDLVNFSSPGQKAGSESCGDQGECEYVFSYPLFRDLEKEQGSFVGIAAHVGFRANVSAGETTLSGN